MQIIVLTAVLILLLILPGALTFWGVLSRFNFALDTPEYKHDFTLRPPDVLDVIGISIAASILVTSLVAFALVFMEIFALRMLVSIVAAYVLMAATATGLIYRRRLRVPGFNSISRDPFLLLFMFCVGASSFILYASHSEDILLYRDPAAYVNTAVNIAKHGTTQIDDRLYYALEQDLQDSLTFEFPVDSVKDRYGDYQIVYRFRGFPRDEGANRTSQQFFNLFPTWQAIGYSVLGIKGVYLISPLFGALSVLFMFLLARRLFGPVAAIVVALLLCVNLAQFWYARAPASEVMTQAVFLAAMFFWLLFSSTRLRVFGVFAGIGLGSLVLVRVDSVLVIGTVVLFFLYLLATRRLGLSDLFFVVPLILGSAFGIVDGLGSSRSYLTWIYVSTAHKGFLWGTLGTAFILAVLVRIAPRGMISSSVRFLEARYAKKIQAALAIGILALAVFAYFVRPELADQVVSMNLSGERLPSYDAETFVQLGWYLTVPGLLLAVAGGMIAITRSMNRGTALFLAIGFAVALYYLAEPRIRPDHFWAIRRFVPIVIPMAVTLIGLSVQTLWSSRSERPSMTPDAKEAEPKNRELVPPNSDRVDRKWLFPVKKLSNPRVLRGVACGTVLAIFLFSARQVSDFVSYKEWEGSLSAVDDVGSRFPKGSIIIFENSWLGSLLAPPLKIVYGHETFVISPQDASESYRTLCGPDSEYPSSTEPQSCVLSRFADVANNAPLFWITEREGGQPQMIRERFTRLDDYQIDIAVPKIEESFSRLPRVSGVFTWRMSGNVYMLERNAAKASAALHE